MLELYGLGMEHKALGTCAIDVVANYGGIKPLGMGSGDTQLARAPRNGIEAYARTTLHIALDLKYSMCRATILGNHLAGAVFVIELQWQAYLAMIHPYNSLKKCDIALLYGARYKLLLQRLMRHLMLCDNKDSRC